MMDIFISYFNQLLYPTTYREGCVTLCCRSLENGSFDQGYLVSYPNFTPKIPHIISFVSNPKDHKHDILITLTLWFIFVGDHQTPIVFPFCIYVCLYSNFANCIQNTRRCVAFTSRHDL